MGNKVSVPRLFTTSFTVSDDENLFKSLSVKTGFTYGQVEQFHERFLQLHSRNDKTEGLCRKDLETLPGIKDNPLGERISEVFISYTEEKDKMVFEEFVETMAKFRTTSGDSKKKKEEKRKEKLEFAFNIYDIDNNDFIEHHELCEVLSKMVGKSSTAEDIEQMADQLIIEMDKDGDQKISFQDYCNSVADDDIETVMSLPFLKRRD